MEYAFSKQLFSELLKRLLVDQVDHNIALANEEESETIFAPSDSKLVKSRMGSERY